jgi:predicted nucleic acid-binding protein/Arc/MetJ family transcription regulator
MEVLMKQSRKPTAERTNIVLDSKLVERVKRLAKVKTTRDAVHVALEHYVRSRDYSGVIALRGTGGVSEGYDPKAASPSRWRKMLVDSSVWIAYLRGDNLIEVELLTEALEHGAPVWLAPPILQEVLQGADSPDRFNRWDRVLGELPMVIAPDPREAARSAANLYARCRWAGVTPRSANDCLIATHAILGGMPLLHCDRDFGLIASVEPKLILVAAVK